MNIVQALIKLGLSLLMMGCLSHQLLAQRTSYKSIHIGLSPKVSCYTLPSGGVELSAGQYLLNSYWSVGVSATDWNQKIASSNNSSDGYFDHVMWNVNGGWMYRLGSSYSRWFNFYVGGKIFLGCNQYEVFKKMPNELEYNFPKLEFIYGLEPSVEMEFYLSRNCALTIGGQAPLTFGSSLRSDLLRFTGSLGIRINL